jgi:hypothetical protein
MVYDMCDQAAWFCAMKQGRLALGAMEPGNGNPLQAVYLAPSDPFFCL